MSKKSGDKVNKITVLLNDGRKFVFEGPDVCIESKAFFAIDTSGERMQIGSKVSVEIMSGIQQDIFTDSNTFGCMELL